MSNTDPKPIVSPKIELLADRLRTASAAYYSGGEPLISDAEYDSLEDALRKVAPDHPVFSEVGAPTSSGWAKVSHPIPMGSLYKAQEEEEFREWAKKTEGAELLVTEKMDGISILLTYEDGNLVRAETRGDGEVGEDITRNVRIMQGVKAMIPYTGTCWVRGEVVCRKSDFAAYFQGESNPRNTASGTGRSQSGWQKAKHLTVFAYNLTTENPDHGASSRSGQFETLREWGFTTPSMLQAESCDHVIQHRQSYIERLRDLCDYDIDGLVVEVDNNSDRHDMGSHNHRPKGAIAFKFPHEAKPTFLKDILWQVGNSGRITPVAVFDAVNLAGAEVEKASLHNVGNILRLVQPMSTQHFAVGDKILVSRRNDVIPFVESLLIPVPRDDIDPQDKRLLRVPGLCPSCQSSLDMVGEYLVCRSEDCPAQALGSLKRWVSKLGVLHFGEALLTAVVDAGMVSSIADLYRLQVDDVAALELDGRRVGGAAQRALDSLNAKKDIALDLFVGSLGIPLVGRKMAKLLADAGFNSLNQMALADVAQMAEVPGFGEGRAQSFREGFDARKDLMAGILAAGVTITAPVVVEQTSSVMAGQAVCFTGVRDKDAEEAIVAAGGTIASGVSKNTTLLVAKDPSSPSGKAKKARDLGIEVIGQEDLWVRLGGA